MIRSSATPGGRMHLFQNFASSFCTVFFFTLFFFLIFFFRFLFILPCRFDQLSCQRIELAPNATSNAQFQLHKCRSVGVKSGQITWSACQNGRPSAVSGIEPAIGALGLMAAFQWAALWVTENHCFHWLYFDLYFFVFVFVFFYFFFIIFPCEQAKQSHGDHVGGLPLFGKLGLFWLDRKQKLKLFHLLRKTFSFSIATFYLITCTFLNANDAFAIAGTFLAVHACGRHFDGHSKTDLRCLANRN